jgi:hypothetical protein
MAEPPPASRLWPLAVLVVVAGQLGLALHLFGPHPRTALADDRPVMSGRHPLHLYHGWLGATAARERGAATGYDPRFQAGYPKTPVFDAGSRPAELFLLLAGGDFSPAAYKRGLLAVCLLVPAAFAMAGWAAGLGGRGATLAAVGGSVLFWAAPARAVLDAGHLDLHLAGLAAVAFLGGLVRYADRPGPAGWLVLAGAAAAGWFAHPLAWLGLLPVFACYYVYRAPRHEFGWHLGLVGVTAAGLVPNLWWLRDWGRFWWLRRSSADDFAPLPGPDRLLGTPADYTAMIGGPLGGLAVVLGLFGVLAGLRSARRTLPGVALAAAACAVLVGRLGATWPPLRPAAADQVGPFAAAVLVLPAAGLLACWWGRTPAGGAATLLAALGVAGLGWLPGGASTATALGLDLRPLPLGLSRDRQQLTDTLARLTTADARILLEDPDPTQPGWNWTALLPVLTGRAFLGGLDPDGGVEHLHCGLRATTLNGRPFADWSADDRRGFARRYNVGWVACRTPAAVAFWAADPAARVIDRLRDGPAEVVLFALDRPHAFVLAGSATVEQCDHRRLVLADVRPAGGEVVLSFHHHKGMRAAPAGEVATDPDPFDPIPLVKLRLPGPVSRLTLTWESP